MLEKITFEKKLGIDSREKKWRGLKTATLAFLVALSGAIVTLLGAGKIGFWIVVVGIGGGFIGIVMHLYAMFSQGSKRER